MTTPQSDATWEREHDIVVAFHTMIEEGDVTGADQRLEQMEDDANTNPITLQACQNLLSQYYADVQFWFAEEMINNKQKHV